MTLQNKITQIILDGAPVNTTIAQIKLMVAKLAALVDNPENATHSHDIKSINGVDIDQSKSHMTVVAMADGLYRSENGKLTKIETKPDLYKDDTFKVSGFGEDVFGTYAVYHPPVEQPKTEERMKLNVNDDGTFSWSKVQVPISEDDGNQGLWGLSRDEVTACASAPYEWVCSSEQDDDSTPSDKPPLDPQSEESLKAMAKLGIDINATQQRPMTICYGNGMDDMFIRYHDERNHWALYNWRMVDVDERDKWLEEARIKLFINVVVCDDLQWIWRNGEWAKAEKWEVS